MIQTLIAAALEHLVPFSHLVGRLEPGITRAKGEEEGWKVDRFKAAWRPYEFSHVLLGRLIPPAPLPSFDQGEINSASSASKAFDQYQEHRICLRVPQRTPFSLEEYEQEDLDVAEQAVALFSKLSSGKRVVRMLTTPSSYMAKGGGIMAAPTMTTQHHPLAIEDVETGNVLWVHPEAQSIVNGQRLGSGEVTPGAPKATKAVVRPMPAAREMPREPQRSQVTPLVTTGNRLVAAPAQTALAPWFVSIQDTVGKFWISGDAAVNAMIEMRRRELMGIPGVDPARIESIARDDVRAQLALGNTPPQEHQTQDVLPEVAPTPRRTRRAQTAPVFQRVMVSEIPEMQELIKFVDDGKITFARIGELIGRDRPTTSRIFSGDRAKKGLPVAIADQLVLIAQALTEGKPMPVALPRPERNPSEVDMDQGSGSPATDAVPPVPDQGGAQEQAPPRRHRAKAHRQAGAASTSSGIQAEDV